MTPKERRNPDILKASRKKRIAAGAGVTVELVNRLLKQHRQMADMMKAMGASAGKRGLMGQLGQMMGFGGGMAMPTPEQIAAMQKSARRRRRRRGGIPSAPPPGAFNLPPQFPGLPGLGAPESARPRRRLIRSGGRRNDVPLLPLAEEGRDPGLERNANASLKGT